MCREHIPEDASRYPGCRWLGPDVYWSVEVGRDPLAGERRHATVRSDGNETIFTMEATPLKYGPGAAEEVGWEIKRLGVGRVMLDSDPGVVAAGITPRIGELIEAEGIEVEVWDRARVEPTDDSLQAAADFAVEGEFDGFVAVGGGTSIDTAKVSDLISTHGGEIMDYVNPPLGGRQGPPPPFEPFIAVPTTSGNGGEGMTVAGLDRPEQKVKT